MLRGDQGLTGRKESLEFKERDTGDMQAPLTPQFCLDSWGFSVCRSPWSQGPSLLLRHNPASEAPATPQHQLGFGDSTNRQRQSRGKTHLTLNTAPEPEVPPWPDQESPRSQFQAQVFPLAPAAAGSQTLQSCRGSGGWLLGAGSTAAGPGIAPSAPTWNRGKGNPALLNPSAIHLALARCSRCGKELTWAGPWLLPALPQAGWLDSPSYIVG